LIQLVTSSVRSAQLPAENPIGHKWALIALATATAALALTGCQSVPGRGASAAYSLTNFHKQADGLPNSLRRVAVLPMTSGQPAAQGEAGVRSLYPVLVEEIEKLNKFETVFVSSEQLWQWTGRRGWNAEEQLPSDLLPALAERLACDAVLFSRLDQFHGYPPMVVGWNLKLVDLNDARILWAADELFDSADPTVRRAAMRYQKGKERSPRRLADARSILVSPRLFGQYTANAALATLPDR